MSAKATNAYELLEQVCEAIAAHPLNYYQDRYVANRGEGADDLPKELDTPANECGTAFCRAGWIVQLHDRRKLAYDEYEYRAMELLGALGEDAEDPYFDVVDLFAGGAVEGAPGSPEYVAEGIAGIRKFMAKHEAHLKAQSVNPVEHAEVGNDPR